MMLVFGNFFMLVGLWMRFPRTSLVSSILALLAHYFGPDVATMMATAQTWVH